jgi:hypothetical protein
LFCAKAFPAALGRFLSVAGLVSVIVFWQTGSGGFRAAELPFGGGRKGSSNSRESMAAVMSEVTQQKSIILRYVFDED